MISQINFRISDKQEIVYELSNEDMRRGLVELEAEENSYLQGIDLLDQFKQKLPDLNFNQNSMDLNSDRFQLYKDKRSKPLSDPSNPKKPINREQSNFAFNFRE